MDKQSRNPTGQDYHPRPSTSRGTQRLYIRLNTLEYLLTHVHSLDHSLTRKNFLSGSGRRINSPPTYFDLARSAILSAIQHVSEVAAYRLIFFDSKSVFYDGLYINGNVYDNRIRPILRALKQNLTLLTAVLTDRVQAIAVKEVMKASFDAFLMVLLAGGSLRAYVRSDHSIVYDDFEALKKVFCSCGDGMVSEEIVSRESKVVEGIIKLMGQSTEQLLEDFSIATCENCKTSDWGITGVGEKLVMPAAKRRWNCSDPTTILRVLCYRNDPVANGFLKKNFNLPKRR